MIIFFCSRLEFGKKLGFNPIACNCSIFPFRVAKRNREAVISDLRCPSLFFFWTAQYRTAVLTGIFYGFPQYSYKCNIVSEKVGP